MNHKSLVSVWSHCLSEHAPIKLGFVGGIVTNKINVLRAVSAYADSFDPAIVEFMCGTLELCGATLRVNGAPMRCLFSQCGKPESIYMEWLLGPNEIELFDLKKTCEVAVSIAASKFSALYVGSENAQRDETDWERARRRPDNYPQWHDVAWLYPE